MKKAKKQLKRVNLSPAENAAFHLEMAKIVNRSELIKNLGGKFIFWGAISFIAYCAFRAIESLAGKTTFADIFLAIITDNSHKYYALLIFSFSGWIYGWRQRKLRMKVIERLSPRCDKLEKTINPHKQSSRITTDGKTNKEDKKWNL